MPQMLDFSPIKGPEGNIEYLCLLSRAAEENRVSGEMIDAVVEEAHAALDRKES